MFTKGRENGNCDSVEFCFLEISEPPLFWAQNKTSEVLTGR